MIVGTAPGTHIPRNSAQTVTNRLLEIGVKDPHMQCMFYIRRFFFSLVYGKNPLKSFYSEPEGCSIGDVGPTKFAQMMIILG